MAEIVRERDKRFMLDKKRVEKIVKAALKEDIGQLDVTTSTVVDRA